MRTLCIGLLLAGCGLLVGCGGGATSVSGLPGSAVFARMASGTQTTATLGAVTGTVTDSNNQGVAQAAITVTAVSVTRTSATGSFAVLSDETGHFGIGQMAPGQYRLTATHEGIGTTSKDVMVAAGMVQSAGMMGLSANDMPGIGGGSMSSQPNDMQSSSGMGMAMGLVTGQGNEPIAGAMVSAPGGHYAMTDSSGMFAMGEMQPGHYDLTVDAAGYHSSMMSVDVAAGQVSGPMHMTMRPGQGAGGLGSASISGTVTDASTHSGILGAQVSVLGQAVTTTAGGAFSLASVRPGMLLLRVTANGYQPFEQPLMLRAGDVLSGITVALVAAGTPASGSGSLAVTVTDATSHLPIRGAMVQVDSQRPFFTDATGVATITDISAGPHLLRAGAPQHGMQTVTVSISAGQTTQSPVALVAMSAMQFGDQQGMMGMGSGGAMGI